jgi:hypothetical protein
MTNINPNHIKSLLIIFVAIALFMFLGEFFLNAKDDKEKAIKNEIVLCASAICINKKIGHQCLEIDPAMTRIVIAEDPNSKSQRIIIETGNSCANN